MPAHKRKPNYNGATTMQELLDVVCDYYGDPVDDRKEEDPDHVSLHDVADRFNITVMKARKLLMGFEAARDFILSDRGEDHTVQNHDGDSWQPGVLSFSIQSRG